MMRTQNTGKQVMMPPPRTPGKDLEEHFNTSMDKDYLSGQDLAMEFMHQNILEQQAVENYR